MEQTLFEQLTGKGHRLISHLNDDELKVIKFILTSVNSFDELTIYQFNLLAKCLGFGHNVIDVYKILFVQPNQPNQPNQ